MPFSPPKHRLTGWKPAPRKDPAAQDPYYSSPEHKRFRAAVLKRDGYQCTATDCETPDRGRGGRLIADHIKPRTKGGSNSPANGRTLCPACDNRRHREKGLRL